jgi:phosphoribosylformylglycinamidine synthase
MAALLPSMDKKSHTASLMSFGYDPDLMERNPYEGAKGSIREALAKFTCLGGNFRKVRLSLQEYFERPISPESWGKPAAALLGALEAQLALEIPAIGGKDSMSGNYWDTAHNIDITVPPTLVAFAAGTAPVQQIQSGALSGNTGNIIILFAQDTMQNEWDVFKTNMEALAALGETGYVRSAYTLVSGGLGVSLALMAFGNNTGIEAQITGFSLAAKSTYQGSVLVEIDGTSYKENLRINEILENVDCWEIAAISISEPIFRITGEIDGELQAAEIPLETLRRAYEQPLAKVYPQKSGIRDWGLGTRDRSSKYSSTSG